MVDFHTGEDDGCVWVQDWHECKETCEGREEENCHDQCSWDYDDGVCETSCEYSDDDGCWFEGGSYDVDEDHRVASRKTRPLYGI